MLHHNPPGQTFYQKQHIIPGIHKVTILYVDLVDYRVESRHGKNRASCNRSGSGSFGIELGFGENYSENYESTRKSRQIMINVKQDKFEYGCWL